MRLWRPLYEGSREREKAWLAEWALSSDAFLSQSLTFTVRIAPLSLFLTLNTVISIVLSAPFLLFSQFFVCLRALDLGPGAPSPSPTRTSPSSPAPRAFRFAHSQMSISGSVIVFIFIT